MTPAEAVNQAAELLQEAARGQYRTEPHHADFYALGMATERALDALFALNKNIGAQLAHYGDDRQLRTDTTRTAAEVMAAALEAGRTLDVALSQGRRAARAMADECARLAVVPAADNEGSEDEP